MAPLKTNKKLPIKPIITPYIWVRLKIKPNDKTPKIKVFKGVKEFNIALMELSNLVSAIENKKAGIKVPKSAVNDMYFHFCLGILFKELNPIESRKSPAKIILKAPNW